VLLDESEKKQQNELALRLVQFQRDINAQHQADLTRFSQNIGYMQRETSMELLKQREGMNYLLKVSQKQ
jgi:ferredoxin-fold anticodon binding domain-containing protein